MADPIDIEPAEPVEGGPRKPFLEHLEDLRMALIKCAVVIFVALIACLFLDDKLAAVLEYPIRRMHLLDQPRPTVTFQLGSVRFGPTRSPVISLPACHPAMRRTSCSRSARSRSAGNRW